MKLSHLVILSGCLWVGVSFAQSEATLDAETEYKRVDARLNDVYKRALSDVPDKTTREALIRAQRAWIAWRDAEAAYRAGRTSGGGSSYSTDYLNQLATLTSERIGQLDGSSVAQSGPDSKPAPSLTPSSVSTESVPDKRRTPSATAHKGAADSPESKRPLSKADWRERVAKKFPLIFHRSQLIIPQSTLISLVGKPDKTQRERGRVYWYYQCSDGIIEIDMTEAAGKTIVGVVNEL